MSNYISSNTYDPTHIDTSAKWRPTAATFPYSDVDEEFDFDEEEIELRRDSIVNKKYKEQESGDFIKGDPQSFGRNFHGIAFEAANHRSGISPIANLYKGKDGPPIGTGGSGQAFRTTGNLRRTGTQWGFTMGNVKSSKRKGENKFRLADYFSEDFESEDHELLENFFLKNQCIFNF